MMPYANVKSAICLICLWFAAATAATAEPVVVIRALADRASEDGTRIATVEVERDNAGPALSIGLTSSGTATPGVDLDQPPAQVVIPAGQHRTQFTLAAHDDLVREYGEGLTISLAPGSYQIGIESSVTILIEDDETVITRLAADLVASEQDDDRAVVRLGIAPAPAAGEVVLQGVLGGTAILEGDYHLWISSPGGTPVAVTTARFTYPVEADASSIEFELRPISDAAVEGAETVTISLSTPGDAVLRDGAQSWTWSIVDDDLSLGLDAVADTDESGTPGSVRISLTAPTPTTITVPLIYGGSAERSEYTAPDTVTITAGSSSAVVQIVGKADALAEGSETIVVALGPTLVGAVDPARRTATITLREIAGVATITTVETVHEGGAPGRLRFNLARSPGASPAVDLLFRFEGTADPLTDLVDPGDRVTVPAGANSVDLLLTAKDDTLAEGEETFVVTLLPGAGYTLGQPASATIAVIDDEPVVEVQALTDVHEGGAAGSLRLRLAGGAVANRDLTVILNLTGSAGLNVATEVAIIGATVTAGQASVVIPRGTTQRDLSVTTTDDLLAEGDEQLTVTVSDRLDNSGARIDYRPSPSLGSATIAILDDEPPKIAIEADGAGTEPGTAGGFALLFDGDGSIDRRRDLSVRLAYSGSASRGVDYTDPGVVVVLPAATHRLKFSLPVLNDDIAESTEQVVVSIVPDAAYAIATDKGSATIAITDDDRPTVRIRTVVAAFREPAGEATGVVERVGPTDAALTVALTVDSASTASVGSDFNAQPSEVVIPAGASSANFTFSATSDPTDEPDETVVITLGTRDTYTIDGDFSRAVFTLRDRPTRSELDILTEPDTTVVTVGTAWTYRLAVSLLPGTSPSDYTTTILAAPPGLTAPAWITATPLADAGAERVGFTIGGTPPGELTGKSLRFRIQVKVESDHKPGDPELLLQDVILAIIPANAG